MRPADFHFDLPSELIAQEPVAQRDQSRLFILLRQTGQFEHWTFGDFVNSLRSGDVLVLNDSRVIPARLRGMNVRTGGTFEMLLLQENAINDWWAMLKPGRRARVGTRIKIQNPKSAMGKLAVTVIETNDEGHRRLRFDSVSNVLDVLDQIGETPLPPYIRRDFGMPDGLAARCQESRLHRKAVSPAPSAKVTQALDRERYQTVFAKNSGSVAAPTAGLHFTQGLLEEIRKRGVEIQFITLHVGLGTFAPVKTETFAAHKMHEERFEVSESAACAVNEAKASGRRVIAVGTTTLRVLESVARQSGGRLVAGAGRTNIFIYPPFDFKIADVLLTNFHLPGSTLLMLVSAFAGPGETRGREMILSAYAEAIRERYRFFSYGDAMLIL